MDYERHEKILRDIVAADNVDELPQISLSTIMRYLSIYISFNNITLSPSEYSTFVKYMSENGSTLKSEGAKRKFFELIKDNYRDVDDIQIEEVYEDLLSIDKVDHLFQEIGLINEKKDMFYRREAESKHKDMMRRIALAETINDLPKNGIGRLKIEIWKCANDNDFKNDFEKDEVDCLVADYLKGEGKDEEDIC